MAVREVRLAYYFDDIGAAETRILSNSLLRREGRTNHSSWRIFQGREYFTVPNSRVSLTRKNPETQKVLRK